MHNRSEKTLQKHNCWGVNTKTLRVQVSDGRALKEQALLCASHFDDIAPLGSRRLRPTLATAPVQLAHAVVTAAKTSRSSNLNSSCNQLLKGLFQIPLPDRGKHRMYLPSIPISASRTS